MENDSGGASQGPEVWDQAIRSTWQVLEESKKQINFLKHCRGQAGRPLQPQTQAEAANGDSHAGTVHSSPSQSSRRPLRGQGKPEDQVTPPSPPVRDRRSPPAPRPVSPKLGARRKAGPANAIASQGRAPNGVADRAGAKRDGSVPRARDRNFMTGTKASSSKAKAKAPARSKGGSLVSQASADGAAVLKHQEQNDFAGSEEAKLPGSAVIAAGEMGSEQAEAGVQHWPSSCGSERGSALPSARSDANAASRGTSVVSTGACPMAPGVSAVSWASGSSASNNGVCSTVPSNVRVEPVALTRSGVRVPSQWTLQHRLRAASQISELLDSFHDEDAGAKDEIVEKVTQLLQERGRQQQQRLQEAEAKLWDLERRNHDLVVENYHLRTKATPVHTIPPVRPAAGAVPSMAVSRYTTETVHMQPVAMTPRGPLTATVALAATPAPPVALTHAVNAARARSESPGPRAASLQAASLRVPALVSGPGPSIPGPQASPAASPGVTRRAFGTSVSMAPGAAAVPCHAPVQFVYNSSAAPSFADSFDVDAHRDGDRAPWRNPTPTPDRDFVYYPSSRGSASPQPVMTPAVAPAHNGRTVGLQAGSMTLPPGGLGLRSPATYSTPSNYTVLRPA
eukprot:TRINITY_DN11569_c0_g1_i1.p1 TRINITY_DN11569_c0_g1~~TRINITY_DN11569_c0_g1_i1.p1  ORF type:complete len:651 (+),score=114.62 TRINITY_DN11569_c0_g1_i1:82-1953(+)